MPIVDSAQPGNWEVRSWKVTSVCFGDFFQLRQQLERLPRRRVVHVNRLQPAPQFIILPRLRVVERKQAQLLRIECTAIARQRRPPAARELITLEAGEDLLRA